MTLEPGSRVRLKRLADTPAFYRLLKDSDPACGRPQWSGQVPDGCRSGYHPAHHGGQGFIPTAAQEEILDDDHLGLLIWGGYRGGKSRVASNKAVNLTLQFFHQHHDKVAGQTAWLIGSTYEKLRAEFSHPDGSVYEDLRRVLPGVRHSKDIAPGEITVPAPCAQHTPSSGLCTKACKSPGAFTIKTKSADDSTSIGMESPIWVILAEAAHSTQDVYFKLVSRVSEARSKFPGYGMLLLEGTADTLDASLGWYAQLWKEGQQEEVQRTRNFRSFSLSSGSNTFVYPGGERDTELLALKAQLTEDRYSEHHLGIPVPSQHRVFTEFSPLIHVQRWNYRPADTVYVGIDPGYSGQPSRYAVEAVQKDMEGHWHVFDEVFVEHMTVRNVIDVCRQKVWWRNPDKVMVIDVAGSLHAGATESNEEIWRATAQVNLGHEKVRIGPGIDRFASMLRVNPITLKPNMTIDPRCPGLISELGGGLDPISKQPRVYSWMLNQQGDRVGKSPHDRYCDAIRAVTYLMFSVLGAVDEKDARKTIRAKSWVAEKTSGSRI